MRGRVACVWRVCFSFRTGCPASSCVCSAASVRVQVRVLRDTNKYSYARIPRHVQYFTLTLRDEKFYAGVVVLYLPQKHVSFASIAVQRFNTVKTKVPRQN